MTPQHPASGGVGLPARRRGSFLRAVAAELPASVDHAVTRVGGIALGVAALAVIYSLRPLGVWLLLLSGGHL